MKPRAIVLLALIGTAWLWLSTPPLGAATFTVANGDIAGLTTAITSANGNGQDDTIELATSGTYTLTARNNGLNGLPQVTPDGGHKLTIHGNGATIERSSAAGIPAFRFLYVQSGANLTLSGLILSNGGFGNFHGGAIYNDGETADVTLTIVGCVLTENSGDYGGAIFNDGYNDPSVPSHTATLTVMNSTVSNNTGTQYGGGIWNESGGIVMNISNCTFSKNAALSRSAGAIQFDASFGTATGSIINSTFTQNSAGNRSYGGAVNVDGYNGSAKLIINHCTFDQNFAGNGGAVAMDGTDGVADVKLSSCTLNENSAAQFGGGVYLSQTGAGTTSLQIGNTILVSGASGRNLAINGAGAIASFGYNLSDDAAGGDATTGPGGFLNQTGDKRNTDPLFDPAGLKDNGGLTQTIALQAASPAIDQGKSNAIMATGTDQRGEPRPFDDPNVPNASGGDGSDIGAYEGSVRIGTATRVGNSFVLTFSTLLGRTYEVQSRPSLTSGTWSLVTTTTPPPPIAGTGGIIQVTIPNAFAFAVGYYRIYQAP